MGRLKKILIVGSGYAGACAARMLTDLGHEVHVFEKGSVPGGMARSFYIDGMTYEFGPHIIANHHCTDKTIQFIKKYVDVEDTFLATASFLQGHYLNYPPVVDDIQYLKEREKIEKELGSLNGHQADEKSFETYLISKVGKTLYQLFYESFTEKFWQVDPATLDASWAKLRRLGENLYERKMFFNRSWCTYPKKDFNELFDNILKGIDVKYRMEIRDIDLDRGVLIDSDGNKFFGDVIISTLSIDRLLNFKYGELDYSGYTIEPVVIEKEYYHPADPMTGRRYSMVYYPEKEVKHCRITEYKSFNHKADHPAYRGRTVITIETPSRKARFYPFVDSKNEDKFRKYIEEFSLRSNIIPLGRMGLYKYTTIDTATEQIFRLMDAIGPNFRTWEHMTPSVRTDAYYTIRGSWNN